MSTLHPSPSLPRFFVQEPLALGTLTLQDTKFVRHVQVLRLDAGAALTLFDGTGGQWQARVDQTRKHSVAVEVLAHEAIERELAVSVHIAVGVPANERMDTLIEKATELGAVSIQPLQTAHGVVRLSGERLLKRQAHWQAIAVAACEQCGRNRVPIVHDMLGIDAWLSSFLASHASKGAHAERVVLSLAPDALRLAPLLSTSDTTSRALHVLHVLSGPEGGLGAHEEAQARSHGFKPASLGGAVLRADTAPLAALVTAALATPRRC